MARARDRGARAGAAVVSGLVDEIESLPHPTQDFLVSAAVEWPDQGVRLLGFAQMVQREGPQAMYDRAIHDRSARVRSWAKTIVDTDRGSSRPDGQTSIPTDDTTTGPNTGGAHQQGPREQPRLF